MRGALDHDWVWLSCVGLLGILQVALITSHTPWLDEFNEAVGMKQTTYTADGVTLPLPV